LARKKTEEKKKNMMNLKRKLFGVLPVAALMLLAMTTSAFAQSGDMNKSMAMESNTIVDVAMRDSRFSMLVELLKEANLVDTLKGAGPFTVFAPTNDAFAKVPQATLAKLKSDPEMLRSVLLYHVLGMKVPSSAARTMKAATAQGSELQVKVKKGNGGATVMVDKATVIQADVMASNGVIHAIDTVLMPKMDGKMMGKKSMK
jgi:Secreted and surface protein containing fasciclin-like repeats